MRSKPKIALLRGPLLSPFEMQSYEPLRREFDLVAITPHATYQDVSSIKIPRESLWCPIAGKIPFERSLRKWQAARDALTGNTHSFCGMVDRLKGFDIYHVMDQYFCFSFEAALAKRKYGGKLLVTQWENIPGLNERKFMERHIKSAVKKEADLFLSMTGTAERALLEEGVDSKKIRKTFGAVDTGHFSPGKADLNLRSALGIPRQAFVVLYVGRLAESKGIFTILEAARKLQATEPDLHFLLVGKDEEGVGDWVLKNGLSGLVHLAGFLPYAEMPRYYRQADLFVLPSLPTKGWLEQFGYVLAEAMACGVPAVGSDCGAIPEVIGNPSRIFPAGSADGFCDVLRKTRSTPLGSARKAARQRAVDLFSSKKLAQTLGRIYEELLGAS